MQDQDRRASAARESDNLFALAQQASGAGTWDIDLITRATQFSPRSLEMLGHPPDRDPAMTAEEWAAHIFPGDAERVLAEGRRATESRSDFSCEYRVVRPDGEVRWVRGLGRAIVDDTGEPVRFVGLNFDVTDLKRSEDEFRRMQSELIHMSRVSAMGAMASTLAHELNQPLSSINNYLAGARNLLNGMREENAEQLRPALARASESAVKASEIIRRLREMTRRRSTEKRRIDLAMMVREAASLALVGAAEQGVSTRFELTPALDVLADDVQIQQVIVNLVRNAIEAMEDGPRRELLIASGRADQDVLIRVDDSGRGVSADARGSLFEPFVSGKPNGLGIGLSIARTIVESHGGQLWAEHGQEGGTSMRFTLPLADKPRDTKL